MMAMDILWVLRISSNMQVKQIRLKKYCRTVMTVNRIEALKSSQDPAT